MKISGEANGSAILQFEIPAWRVLQQQQGCAPQLPVTWGLVSWLFSKDPYVDKSSKEWDVNLHYARPIAKGSTSPDSECYIHDWESLTLPRSTPLCELWWSDFQRPSKPQTQGQSSMQRISSHKNTWKCSYPMSYLTST